MLFATKKKIVFKISMSSSNSCNYMLIIDNFKSKDFKRKFIFKCRWEDCGKLFKDASNLRDEGHF